MTLLQTIRRLQKLYEKHGNVKVGVDWAAIRNSSNGVYDIGNISEFEFDHVAEVDGDGFMVVNKDGSERTTRTVVIK